MLNKFEELSSPKAKNLKLLYSLVRKLGPVTINTLAEHTGFKHVTCGRLLDELVAEDLIYDSGIGKSSGGRKPLAYVIKPDAYNLIGVEITSLYTTVLLLDLKLNIIGVKKLKMTTECTGEYTLNYVAKCVEDLLAEHNVPRKKLLGIGIGVLDSFDPAMGVISHPQLFPAGGWDINIIEYLKHKTNTPVFLENGTNLAALAEYRMNFWKETDNLVFVSSDIGIRCGTIFQGRLVSRKRDMDDTFGHIIIDIHGRRCSCGSYGCLQAYSSLPAIRDEMVRLMKRGKPSMLTTEVNDFEEINLHHILYALEQNDALCLEVVEDAAYYFGVGLSNLIFLLRPEIVIFGGTLVPKPRFFEVAAKTAQDRLKFYPDSHVQIIKSTEAYNIVAQGAGCMVLDYFTEEVPV
ncbi:ROK family protein [Paenibacillus polymyxa]|uniref:ROK family protein n=1 Tax=Paenibacillus TaxID=44249 RepID=UPI00042E3F9B|nr:MULTISPECIES: ROK family protein [Paenibacillus]AHM64287.1 ROK family protein [Paenibacillus polymyxa SQR-21]AIY09962.1 ROK family transcriptional regulator [Paenibacillus polymyxa]AUS24838.1 ROK family protein [Paenibacillus polymyxa]KAF6653921.1 ROK family protein [Paenibacillus sp. EKM301P]KJK28963.1 ROK family transcriptional regulator [Paenibacillus polymyxa]